MSTFYGGYFPPSDWPPKDDPPKPKKPPPLKGGGKPLSKELLDLLKSRAREDVE